MQLRNIILVFTLLLSCINATSLRANEVAFVNGAVHLSGKLPDGKIASITILTSKVGSNNPYKKAFNWGGDANFPPTYFISSFKEKINGQTMPVSLSSYVDLGNPENCWIDVQRDGFSIVIVGGDAGVSYRAILLFKNIGGYFLLYQRKVMSGEFPEERWQETTYHYNTDVN